MASYSSKIYSTQDIVRYRNYVIFFMTMFQYLPDLAMPIAVVPNVVIRL